MVLIFVIVVWTIRKSRASIQDRMEKGGSGELADRLKKYNVDVNDMYKNMEGGGGGGGCPFIPPKRN